MGGKLRVIGGLEFFAWALLNAVSITVCCVCEKKVFDFSPICDECLSKFLVIDKACESCGQPLFVGDEPISTCGDCQPLNPQADRTGSAFFYEGVLQEVLPLFKYKRRLRIGRLLAVKLLERLQISSEEISSLDGIIPIPLSSNKLRKREFNQSAWLSREIARQFNLPLEQDLVKKIKNTPAQVGLSRTDRKKSVKGSFAIVNPKLVKGKRFLVVDDVLTTGATSTECCKVLKKSGAEYLWLYTLARR